MVGLELFSSIILLAISTPFIMIINYMQALLFWSYVFLGYYPFMQGTGCCAVVCSRGADNFAVLLH